MSRPREKLQMMQCRHSIRQLPVSLIFPDAEPDGGIGNPRLPQDGVERLVVGLCFRLEPVIQFFERIARCE